jgi:MarR family transcriptional regulator, transcriptional regulator for hemolysin
MAAKRTREWADATFARHGASLVTWIVLKHALHAAAPGFSQSELAADMSIGGPALVRHLDRLEAEGLVARRRDPTDRRITRVTITAKGRRRHDQLAEVAADTDRQLRTLLSDREAKTLTTALARIENHFETDVRSETA